MANQSGHGGARKGSGRKPKLTLLQKIWLKNSVQKAMDERAIKRVLYQHSRIHTPVVYEEDDENHSDELSDIRKEMHQLPLNERKSRAARDLQSSAAEIIGKQRLVRVGTGRGPLMKSGPYELDAQEIREQVASEANKLWGRNDVTERMVRSACEQKYTEEQIFSDYLARQCEATSTNIRTKKQGSANTR